jgi:hypothetical protein
MEESSLILIIHFPYLLSFSYAKGRPSQAFQMSKKLDYFRTEKHLPPIHEDPLLFNKRLSYLLSLPSDDTDDSTQSLLGSTLDLPTPPTPPLLIATPSLRSECVPPTNAPQFPEASGSSVEVSQFPSRQIVPSVPTATSSTITPPPPMVWTHHNAPPSGVVQFPTARRNRK